MTKKEKQFIDTIQLLGFEPQADFDGEVSNSDYLKVQTFLHPTFNLEIWIEECSINGIIQAIHRAGIEIGEKNRTQEIKNHINRLKEIIGME